MDFTDHDFFSIGYLLTSGSELLSNTKKRTASINFCLSIKNPLEEGAGSGPRPPSGDYPVVLLLPYIAYLSVLCSSMYSVLGTFNPLFCVLD